MPVTLLLGNDAVLLKAAFGCYKTKKTKHKSTPSNKWMEKSTGSFKKCVIMKVILGHHDGAKSN